MRVSNGHLESRNLVIEQESDVLDWHTIPSQPRSKLMAQIVPLEVVNGSLRQRVFEPFPAALNFAPALGSDGRACAIGALTEFAESLESHFVERHAVSGATLGTR